MNHNDYTALIAGYHFEKPLFTEWIYALTEPLAIAQRRLAQMQSDFDIDTAIGVQLDAVGVRVGISRTLPLKLTGVYFAFDDVDGLGFDLGVWKGEYDPDDGSVTLDDSIYRAVLKSKVLSNSWDGKNESLPDLLRKIMSFFNLSPEDSSVQDLQNMGVVMRLNQQTLPPILLELFNRRTIDFTAAGVELQISQTQGRPVAE